MARERDRSADPERAAGTTERASDSLVWKNPPNTQRTKPSSHSTGGGKDHTLPREGEN